jgi:simple sugar transport system substrate-binding protein
LGGNVKHFSRHSRPFRVHAQNFDQVGVKAGDIPVIGWGNSIDAPQEVLDGYMATWQDPQATSYLALSVAARGIPPGFDIHVGTL